MKNNHFATENETKSSLFGILEGNAKAKKEAAAADAKVKVETARQQTLLLETLANQQGYNPNAAANAAANAANQSEVDKLNAESSSERTLYWILGAVVVAVMVGLYFIKRKK